MLDTVLFDMDGTLLDTLADLDESVNYALRACGFAPVSVEQTRQAAGWGSLVLMDELCGHALRTDSPEFAHLHRVFAERYDAHRSDHTRPYEGIEELLGALKARGVKMAVVSNKLQNDVEHLAQEWFAGVFDVAIGRVDGVPPKPAPDMPLQALESLGSTPAHALYLGDSEPDAQTAENIGCTGVCCTWGFRSREVLESLHPDYLIDEPRELIAVLDAG